MRDFLLGGGASSDTMEAHRRWGYLARLFFMAADKEHGSMLHYWVDGGTSDQPCKTHAVFELMQNIFVEHLNKVAQASTR